MNTRRGEYVVGSQHYARVIPILDAYRLMEELASHHVIANLYMTRVRSLRDNMQQENH